MLNQLLAPRTHKGILATLGDGDAVAQLEATRQAAEKFFSAVHQWHLSQPQGTGRVREPGIVPDHLSEELPQARERSSTTSRRVANPKRRSSN